MSGILGDLAVIGGGLVSLALAALGIWKAGKSKGKDDAEDDAIQKDLETAKRIDAVRPSGDSSDARKRLELRQQQHQHKRDL